MIQKIKTFIKELFTKADKTDKVITFENGSIGLKDPLPPYKAEPKEELPHNMSLHAVYKGRVENGFEWEINGVHIIAEDIISAQRKYLRTNNGEN